jgi:geranylgeranylglycerol-phosphate geranylgeranyltransferase
MTSFIIALASTFLIHFYSIYFKRLLLVGNIVVSFFTGLAFVYGGTAVGSIKQSIIPAGFAFLVNLIREIVKDIEDIAGDSLNSIVTFPQQYGLESTRKLLIALIVLIMLLTPLPFIMKVYNVEYFVIVMVSVNVIFLSILKLLLIKSFEPDIAKISRLLKANMIIGLAAIFIGVKL